MIGREGQAMNKFYHSKAPGRVAKGRPKTVPGTMNGTEKQYAEMLEVKRQGGEVLWYAYESVKLRLADKTFLTVDFFVMNDAGELEAHEVKGGFWEDDARVKMKVAASMYPFRFIAAQKLPKKKGGGWKVEEFKA